MTESVLPVPMPQKKRIPRPTKLGGLGLILALAAALWMLGQTGRTRPVIACVEPRTPEGTALPAPDLASLPGFTFVTPLTATMQYTSYFPILTRNATSLHPDLVITHVAFNSPNITAGQPFALNVTVLNQGAGDTRQGSPSAWFTLEVYIKDHAFTPAGPPANPLDHAGGYCSDSSPDCATGTERPAHLVFVGGLGPGEPQVVVFTLTFPDSGLYDLYLQVDTTWATEGYAGQLWGQHLEEDEGNNIFAVEDIFVPAAR